MKKFIPLLIVPLISLWIIPLGVFAATIIDGDLVKTPDSPDVYIVKLIPSTSSGQAAEKYKRLILNPEIFNQYSHLKWENIKIINSAELDDYTTSDLVRAVDDEKVYRVFPNGDAGEKRWIKTANDFLDLGYNWNAIYNINNFERDFYSIGAGLEAPKAPVTEEPTIPARTSPITIKVPFDYSTIQAAINAAINGDTISVNNGTYNENIIINKGIKLIGESVGGTIINGGGNDNAITIGNVQNVLIQRFTIKSKDKYGIYCNNTGLTTATLKNNFIINSGWGVVAENNCQLTFLNNLIYNNKNSANIDGAGILIKNNVLYNITTEVRNNTITDNYHGIWSEDANVKVLNNIIAKNIGGIGAINSMGIYHSGQGKPDNTYNDVWSNGWDYKGDASAGSGSLNSNPRFVQESQRNYNLTTGIISPSPCLDAGHPDMAYYDGTLITTNQYRNDMGAYGGPDNIGWSP